MRQAVLALFIALNICAMHTSLSWKPSLVVRCYRLVWELIHWNVIVPIVSRTHFSNVLKVSECNYLFLHIRPSAWIPRLSLHVFPCNCLRRWGCFL